MPRTMKSRSCCRRASRIFMCNGSHRVIAVGHATSIPTNPIAAEVIDAARFPDRDTQERDG